MHEMLSAWMCDKRMRYYDKLISFGIIQTYSILSYDLKTLLCITESECVASWSTKFSSWGHTAGQAAGAHPIMCLLQVRRQRVSEASRAGQLLHIETLQDLTVAAAPHSHYAIFQKFMDTWDAEAKNILITTSKTKQCPFKGHRAQIIK